MEAAIYFDIERNGKLAVARQPITMKKTSFMWPFLGAIALVLIPLSSAPKDYAPVPDEQPLLPAIVVEEKATTTDDALDVYLSRLAWTYECTGECARNHGTYKRIDSNGLYSYGCLQFQEATYLHQAKKYGIDPWKGDGIYSCDNQLAIARAMFLDDPEDAANHWYTSIYKRGLGLPKMGYESSNN